MTYASTNVSSPRAFSLALLFISCLPSHSGSYILRPGINHHNRRRFFSIFGEITAIGWTSSWAATAQDLSSLIRPATANQPQIPLPSRFDLQSEEKSLIVEGESNRFLCTCPRTFLTCVCRVALPQRPQRREASASERFHHFDGFSSGRSDWCSDRGCQAPNEPHPAAFAFSNHNTKPSSSTINDP